MAFDFDTDGYLTHWLFCGPAARPYDGPEGTESEMRRNVIEGGGGVPNGVQMGGPSPLGDTWRFYHPAGNIFLEQSAFYSALTRLDLYATTDIVSNRMTTLDCRAWTANTVEVWQGAERRVRYTREVRKKPTASPTFTLNLRPGHNRIALRLQELAVRDTPFMVALQALEDTTGLTVALPGLPTHTDAMEAAERWLAGVALAAGALSAESEPPCGVEVVLDRPTQAVYRTWTPTSSRFEWHEPDVAGLTLRATAEGQTVERVIERPSGHAIAVSGASLEDARKRYLEEMAVRSDGNPVETAHGILARRALNTPDRAGDESALQDATDFISARLDCADFRLATLLRLYALGWGDREQRLRIRMTALGFRYWTDEPGTDAMAFGSENHALLFHTCRWLAGKFFPGDTFSNSGRIGSEQAESGRAQCEAWVEQRERQGFSEFLSSNYMPLTVGALLNIVDFCADDPLAERASALVDEVLTQLATHTFDSVFVAPQGRVYRAILHPHTSSAQGLLAWFLPNEVAHATTPWAAFPATSKYLPPDDLRTRATGPAAQAYRQDSVHIHLKKTAGAMLSSLELPAPDGGGLQPGERGYQQHLWHATVARDCHVFVNHPGTSCDRGISRPGYWFGNGYLPRVRQVDDTLMAVYDIPDDHPILFTHAHWPADVFSRTDARDGWHFGARAGGCVGLWCSAETVPWSDILVDRELRAYGRRTAWICVCADAEGDSGFEELVARCVAGTPTFDPNTRKLSFAGNDLTV